MFELKVGTYYDWIGIYTFHIIQKNIAAESFCQIMKHTEIIMFFFLQDSISVEKRKEFYICCLLFCFKTLPLNIVAKLPATGFVAGQNIKLVLEIDNQSSKNVENFRIEFYKVGFISYFNQISYFLLGIRSNIAL